MKRLTYISNFSRPLTFEDIEQIGETSNRNNKRDNLTGALFCFRNIFYQIIEGEEAAVQACFDRISKDDRHESVFILQAEQNVEHRAYPDWSMKTVVLDENTDTLVRPIKNLLDSLSRTHRILEKYTSGFVRRSIEQGENPLQAPSQKKDAIVMFSDIVGSTTLTEFLPVEQVNRVLDAFYEISTRSVREFGGDLLKLTGDGFMARFAPDAADAALGAARSMQEGLLALRDAASGDDPLQFLFAGVGITRGEVLEGNIGSGSRRDYTLLGDTVNTAARLEGVTRRVGRSVVFDENIYHHLREQEHVRRLGLYRPKGKTAHLNIYSCDGPGFALKQNGRSLREALQERTIASSV